MSVTTVRCPRTRIVVVVATQYLNPRKLVSKKVLKTLCYSAKLAAGLYVTTNPDLSKRLAIFSSKISGARATLRLIDDIPMLQYTLEYGLGSKVGTSIATSLESISHFGQFTGTRQDAVRDRSDNEYCGSHLLSGGENMLVGRTQVHLTARSRQMGYHQLDILGDIDLLEFNEVSAPQTQSQSEHRMKVLSLKSCTLSINFSRRKVINKEKMYWFNSNHMTLNSGRFVHFIFLVFAFDALNTKKSE